jgi:hypothetical protein
VTLVVVGDGGRGCGKGVGYDECFLQMTGERFRREESEGGLVFEVSRQD